MRRDDPFEAEGVPGTIDIMSSVAGSSLGERIASLKLSPTLGDDVYGSSDPFILSASEVNQTQVYMVAMPSNDSDNSNTTTSSNSTDPASFRRVALTIPLFNAEEAMMKSYCATFDAKPSAPSPLTMERCTNGTTTDEHKSQVFAYDPNTGSIQPMWFDGEDDGMTDDGDEGGEDDPSMDAPNNSTETAPVDPSTDADATVARIANLDEKLLDSTFGDATRPASFVAFAKSFAQDSGYPNAQNVTLVFTPAAPEVIPQAAAEEKLAGEASAASPTDAAATASDSVAVTSDSVSTTITFSAASAAATSLSSSSVTDVMSTSVAPSSTSDDSAIAADVPSSSASGISTTPLSATTSAASTHGLDVEVYDPDATASGVASTSSATISSVSPTRSDLASDSLDAQAASSTASTSTSSASTMTPVSTAPYEWMFKEGLAKSS
ncbi:hypothetical protein PHLCEN_2v2345 [Hermanssonia centrifuga]|uniref:Uncharacterized protein n=1 Tax=Hermanssonia centrifuga TaxID=98765 RepID=A0A2R6RM66_9APHY|nr:hypothetical protein PHLCEN_2v2345 [Hermanssonia centrifuga]